MTTLSARIVTELIRVKPEAREGGPMSNKFGISMGALADPILKQITDQGYEAKAGLIAQWQQDADAVCRLRIRGVLTDAEAHKANKRLFAAISKGVKRVQQ